MKNNYYAIYQCPMCGKKFRIADDPSAIDPDQFPDLIAKIIRNQQFINNNALFKAPMHLPHKCETGDAGIAQLIGFRKV